MRSVDELCDDIRRHQLLPSADLAAMRARWLRPGRQDAQDSEKFLRWLVLNHYLTAFVARVLTVGRPDQLVLNQYRIQGHIVSGPMAGAYLAVDPLHRPAAIEVLAPGAVADPGALRDTVQTVQRAMEVRHANVARTLDIGLAHGLHYVAREYARGTTLAEVLTRRGKLPPVVAARIFAQAMDGLQALDDHGVPAGDLNADCIVLVPAGKHAPGEFTVKILHAGLRRRMIDASAVGRPDDGPIVPNDLRLADSATAQLAGPGTPNSAEEIFQLGRLFYRSVTGQEPYGSADVPRAAAPIAGLAPEVPEMLAGIIERMINPEPAQRPQTAAHVAKALRVFIAAEEHAPEASAEERIAPPARHATADSVEGDEDDEQEDEGPPRRRQRPTDRKGFLDRLNEIWEEYQPSDRDLVFFTLGPLAFILIIFVLKFFTGWTLANVVCLLTGIAVTYFAERFVRWRQSRD
jgi:serine/threonine-protein kinase